MIWINGQPSQGNDLVLDEGFLFGRGVFETIRVEARPLFWAEHLARLNASLVNLRVRPPVDPDELLALVESLAIRHCVLKIIASPANLVLQTRSLPEPDQRGWRLTLAAGCRTANPLLLAAKSLNYLDHLLIWEKARQDGFDDAILLNASGAVAETTRANLFWIDGGQIRTPDLSCGLLNGIVRQWILKHFAVQTGSYGLQDVLSSEAAFITNSVTGIRLVTGIDGQDFANSSQDLIRLIEAQYQEVVKSFGG